MRRDALHELRAVLQAGRRMPVAVAGVLQAAQRACTLHPALHRGDQVPRADRLAQEIVGAEFQHLVLQFRVRVAGEEHHRHVREILVRADALGQRGAFHVRQVQVHQHEVGLDSSIAGNTSAASATERVWIPEPPSTLSANGAWLRSSSTIGTR